MINSVMLVSVVQQAERAVIRLKVFKVLAGKGHKALTLTLVTEV